MDRRLGLHHDSGWSSLSGDQYGYMAPNHMMPRRGMRPWRRRMMRPWRRQMMMEQARRQAEYDNYMQGGWGTPGWATQVAAGYNVPGTVADNPSYAPQPYYGGLFDDGSSDMFDAEFDAVMAEEEALERMESSATEDFGALATQDLGSSSTTVAVLPHHEEPKSTFWEAMKMGAGLGVGILGVATVFDIIRRG